MSILSPDLQAKATVLSFAENQKLTFSDEESALLVGLLARFYSYSNRTFIDLKFAQNNPEFQMDDEARASIQAIFVENPTSATAFFELFSDT